jgi:hypothetical protein
VRQQRFLVDGLPVDRVTEYRFQTRPFDQWIEVRYVSVHPGTVTRVEIVASDGA